MTLSEDYIVLTIPKATVELEINAKVYYDGDIMDVTRYMDMEEIKKAIKEAEDGYIPPDTEFYLTDKGRAAAEELENHGR